MGLDRLILEKNPQKRYYFWSPIPKCICQNTEKSEHFCKNQKCSFGPKTQNEPLNFSWTEASQIGRLGGSDTWEKLPNNPVFFFFDGLPNCNGFWIMLSMLYLEASSTDPPFQLRPDTIVKHDLFYLESLPFIFSDFGLKT